MSPSPGRRLQRVLKLAPNPQESLQLEKLLLRDLHLPWKRHPESPGTQPRWLGEQQESSPPAQLRRLSAPNAGQKLCGKLPSAKVTERGRRASTSQLLDLQSHGGEMTPSSLSVLLRELQISELPVKGEVWLEPCPQMRSHPPHGLVIQAKRGQLTSLPAVAAAFQVLEQAVPEEVT
eukprot:CAMPEP_0197692504 /NCGR_PEP_ID=MMETSP1338-20131121/111181_1 /TAXON_ID=43686 ORGANISM="Pelagodinium beii, Strain RCC1491" /NCGR_SAMPLE_ID=MMETSP1338 /ASSEMBLY_ACC=CAM_ASM_000754 /LENGTH=176 /DNA_ID=CAMNT_0043275169 /DNA_START=745 /DNA_END=1276 /DNA_ORIENTATION=+